MSATATTIQPGLSLGPLHLGASLHDILTVVKSDVKLFPKIDLHYSSSDPLTTPVTVELPKNGLRLRFDGPDQRLRLIEVLEFNKMSLVHKGRELIKPHDTVSRPSFRRIYDLFGATYEGEYLAPTDGSGIGTYVLSWNGIAFTFPLQHSAWTTEKEHVTLLNSAAASPATRMALFEGSSWPEARNHLFVREPSAPRLPALASRPKDNLPAEVEHANLQVQGRVQLYRRDPAASFTLVINETTAQDLITELGPPDATHRRGTDVSVLEPSHRRTGSTASRPISNGRANAGSQPSSYSSTGTDTFDADFDSGDADDDPVERANRETFWCYFSHGMDILVGPPSESSSTSQTDVGETPLGASPHLVVTKVILHGNVPGSYAFNRHRRLRWNIDFPNAEFAGELNSESKFDEIKEFLVHIHKNAWPESEMSKGKVVNRTWGSSPSDSSFFLFDDDREVFEGGESEQWLGNTRLYTFPGMVFEVLENGAVSAVTVY